MQMKFINVALQRVAKSVKDADSNERLLPLQVVIELSGIAALFRWILLVIKYRSNLHLRSREQSAMLHSELQNSLKQYPELEGFDLASGDPFLKLVTERAMGREEIIEAYGDSVVCVQISTDVLEELLDAIMEYNFYYMHKKLFAEQFKQAETKMSELSKQYRWPARGSWNAFVPKEERKKKVVNFDWMSEYSSKEA